MTASDAIRIDRSPKGVLTLTINRPDKKNALTDAMYRTLADALRGADADRDVGAVMLTGAGGVFTAGNDLEDFLAIDAATPVDLTGAAELLKAVASVDLPVVAAVEGPAVGIGTTILLHCDFAYAGPTALFAAPFVDLGLCVEGAASVLAVERLGRRAAHRLLLLGDALSAAEAEAAGLVDQALDAPLQAATATAERLAAKPREALRETKRLMRAATRPAVLAAFDREFQVFGERLRSEEAKAAIGAFLASRKR